MSLPTDIAKSAAELLEPNLQFYRKDPSDESRYFVGPEVLSALAWTATAIAVPILLCAVNEVVKDRVQAWLRKRKEENDPTIEPPDSLQKELAVILKSKGGIAITSAQVSEATSAVAELLSHRGWPKVLAESDATAIVELIREQTTTKS